MAEQSTTAVANLEPTKGAERIRGRGEMATLVRAFAWETTALGHIAEWPLELVMAVNLMLSSNVITTLFWGPEMVMIYNDLYRPHLGSKHPALGHTLRTAWSEVYDLVKPMFLGPLETGVATLAERVSMQVLMNEELTEKIYTLDVNPVQGEREGKSVVLGLYQTAIDHTESVQTARRLAMIEAQAERILASIGDAVIVTDAENHVIRMNVVAETLTGWDTETARHHPLSEVFRIINETTRQIVENPADKVKRLGTIVGLANHTILIREDGTEVSIDDSAAPVRNDAGELTGIVLVFRDIAEKRAIEQQKEALAEQLRQVLEATTDAVVTTDRSWNVNYMNPRAQARYGGEALGQNHWKAFPAVFYEGSPVVEHYEAAMNEGKSSQFDLFYPEPLNLSLAIEVQPTKEGIVLFSQDVTAQRRAELEKAELARETQLNLSELQAIYNTVGIGLGLLDAKTLRYQRVNKQLADMFGKPAEEVVGTCILDFAPDVEGLRAILQGVATGTPALGLEIEGELSTDPGQHRYWLVDYLPVRVDGGEVTAISSAVIEVTEKRKQNQALILTEKLAAVGRLSASIAHEINNPLEAVTNLLYLARTADNLPDVHDHLDIAERELRRVSVITGQTLRFYRQSSRPTHTSCTNLFQDALSIYQGRLINSRVSVEKRKRASQSVECFDGEIRQILNNLIGNAIDAMHPGGGRLLVRSRDTTNWRTGQKGLALTVADTGMGMSPVTRKKLFEAFYSTKGIGGTGLGLWVSKEIMERHHGTLRVRSSQKEGASGSVFTLFLPFEAVSR